MRDMYLAGAENYTFEGRALQRGDKIAVDGWDKYRRLKFTGLFIEDPPLQQNTIQYVGGLKKVRINLGGIIHEFSSDRVREVDGFAFIDIMGQNFQFRAVPLLEKIDLCITETGGCNFLFSRDMGLGDVLIALDGIRALKLSRPKLHITFATLPIYMEIVSWCPHVDEVTDITKVDARKWDASKDAVNWVEQFPECTEMHRADLFARILSVELKDHKIEVNVPEVLLNKMKRVISKGKRKVGLQVYGSNPFRSLNLENTLTMLELFQDDPDTHFYFFDGAKREEFDSLPNVTNLSGKLSVQQFVAGVRCCDFFISPDSGGYHVSSFEGNTDPVPSLVVFGTIHEAYRVMYYPNVYPIRNADLDCSPCWDRARCPRYAAECMVWFDGGKMAIALRKMMEGKLPRIITEIPARAGRAVY